MSIPPYNDLRVSLIPEHAQRTEFDDHAPDATTKFHEIEPDMAYHTDGPFSSPIRTHRSNSDVNDVNPFTSRSLLRATPGLLPLSTAEPLYDSVHTGLGSPANRSTWGSVGDDYKGNASLSPIRRPRLLSTSMADVNDLMCGMSDEGGIKRRLSTAGTPSERRARKASPAGVSTVHTTFSISSALVNVGLLSAPYAFAKSGSLSLAVLPIVCLLMFSAAEKVKVCLKRLDSVVRYPLAPLEKDFSLMAYVCFGEIGRSIISTVFVVELTSAMLTYFIMIENSVVATVPTWNNLGVLVASGIFSFFLLFVPMDWLASFQVLSAIAVLVVMVALFASVYLSTPYLGDVLIECLFSSEAWKTSLATPGVFANLWSSFSLFVYAYGNIPCLPAILVSMKNPKDQNKALGWGFISSLLCYGAVSIIGFAGYGALLNPSFIVNISTDPEGNPIPHLHYLQSIACFAFSLKLQLSLPLLATPVLLVLEHALKMRNSKAIFRILLRAAFVCFMCVVAYFCADELAALAGLFGACLTTPLSLLFPGIVHWKLTSSKKRSVLGRSRLVLEMLFALVLAIGGTVVAIAQLIGY